jgi:hypothetical protein
MSKITDTERPLRNQLRLAEAAAAAKAQELEDHLKEAAVSHRAWLVACLACALVGAIVGHLL